MTQTSLPPPDVHPRHPSMEAHAPVPVGAVTTGSDTRAQPRMTDIANQVVEALPGIRLFKDVFRRADKNDDGSLDLEEFSTFFSDSVVSKSDTAKLFMEVDADSSGNISVDELTEFMMGGFADFSKPFGLLEDLNEASTTALGGAFHSYATASKTDQFKTRTYMRSIVDQLEALTHLYGSALRKCEDISTETTWTAPDPRFAQSRETSVATASDLGFPVLAAGGASARSSRRSERRKSHTDMLHHARHGAGNAGGPGHYGGAVGAPAPPIEDDEDPYEIEDYTYRCDKWIVQYAALDDARSIIQKYINSEHCHRSNGCLSLNVQAEGNDFDSGPRPVRLQLFSMWSSPKLALHLCSKEYKAFRKELNRCLDAPWSTNSITFGQDTFDRATTNSGWAVTTESFI